MRTSVRSLVKQAGLMFLESKGHSVMALLQMSVLF